MPLLAAARRSLAWPLVALAAAALPACLPDNNHLDDPSATGSPSTQAGQAGAVSGGSGHGGSAVSTASGQAGGQGLAGSSAGAAGGQGTMPIGGSAGSSPAGSGGASSTAGSGQAGSEPENQAGSDPGNGQAGMGQPTSPASACPVGAYTGDTSLPEASYCSCINHTYQNDEPILTFNGASVVARFLPNGVMYAWHTTESGTGAPKPGNWLSNAGYPAKCARRFAYSPGDGQPVETWTPPAPLAAPSHCYASGDVVCVSDQQGTIYVKQTPSGQRYLCRSYPGQSFEQCGFVPSTWASGGEVCSDTPENAQQFLDEGEDPSKTRPCGS